MPIQVDPNNPGDDVAVYTVTEVNTLLAGVNTRLTNLEKLPAPQPPQPEPEPPKPQPSPTVPPVTGDATTALQTAFNNAAPGSTLVLTKSTYRHSGVLQIRVPNITVDGGGATLTATNDTTSSLQITADGVTLRNINLTAPLTGARYSEPNQHKLVVTSDGVTVKDVTVTGSAASGVFLYGASGFLLERVTVRDTRADAIHMTGGSSNGRVLFPVVERSGDDGVAVVSYGGDGLCHHITVESPTVTDNKARGVSVVGGSNVVFRNVNITRSAAAGVYVACEPAWTTEPVDDVTVDGGKLTGCNTAAQTVHGAGLVYNGRAGFSVTNVTMSNLVITGTPAAAGRNLGVIKDMATATVTGVVFRNIALDGTLTAVGGNARASWTATGFTRNGQPITP